MPVEFSRRDIMESVLLRPMLLHLYFSDDGGVPEEVAGAGYAPKPLLRDDFMLDASGQSATFKARFWFGGSLGRPVRGYYLTRPGSDAILYANSFPGDGYDVWRLGDTIEIEDTLRF